jgi:fucose permease
MSAAGRILAEASLGRRLPALLAAAGVASVGYGTYMHLTMGDRTLGNCVASGACDPWDPQWVLAPLALGAILLVVGVALAPRD